MYDENYIAKLKIPNGRIDVILDTDTYNEIDDGFALAYLLSKGEKLRTAGICAAPFLNSRSVSPADGMEKSYDEILKILSLAERNDLIPRVYKGSEKFLADEKTPVRSDAADFIIGEAEKHSAKDPLYIVAIGAVTNVASAILKAPDVMYENTVVVWLGGNAVHWEHTREFNMKQDVSAARIVTGCSVPLILLPCMGVVSSFTTTGPELRHFLSGKNALCDYLVKTTVDEAEKYAKGMAWSRCIWDVTAVARLLDDGDRFMSSRIIPAPIPQYDGFYSFSSERKPMRYTTVIWRDNLFTDLFSSLAAPKKVTK